MLPYKRSPFLTHLFPMGTAASGCQWSLGGLGWASIVTASAPLGCAFDFKIKLHPVLRVVPVACVHGGDVWSWRCQKGHPHPLSLSCVCGVHLCVHICVWSPEVHVGCLSLLSIF